MRLPWRAAITPIAVAACLAAVLTASASPSVAQADRKPGIKARTYSVATLGPDVDIPNPLRGQYRWFGTEPKPAPAAAGDVYYRDQVYWGRIEPADNVWDFSWIEAGLADAEARGGKFGFRVMAYCPGCWMEARQGFPSVTPPFVPTQTGGSIPAWNSPGFHEQWAELIAELSRRYADDPRLGYIDVGGYGSYGEWHVDAGEKITDPNGLAIVKTVADAFPKKHVLINTMTAVSFTVKALRANRNLGLRTDGLGCPDMYSMVAVDKRLQSVWKTRPFFTEWCTRSDPVLGARQVKQFHISTMSSGNMPWRYEALASKQRSAYLKAVTNAGYRYQAKTVTMPARLRRDDKVRVTTVWRNTGTAPTYDTWRVQLTFVDTQGRRVTKSLGTPLKKVLNQKTFTRKVTTSGLAEGGHRVYISVVDPTGYSLPMKLANAKRTTDGSYLVGSVTVR